MWGGLGFRMSRFFPDQGPEVFHIHLQLQGKDRSMLDCFASSSLVDESAIRGFTWEAQGSWPMRRAGSFNRPNSTSLQIYRNIKFYHIFIMLLFLIFWADFTVTRGMFDRLLGWEHLNAQLESFQCQLRRLCQEHFKEVTKTMKQMSTRMDRIGIIGSI